MTNAMLRNATPADQDSVLSVFLDAWTKLCLELGIDIDMGNLPRFRIDATKVALVDDELVGFFRLNESRELLERIYVNPVYQHSGVGGLLLKNAEELGAKELWVDEGNVNAQRFYESHGWADSGLRAPGYLVPESVMLRYERK